MAYPGTHVRLDGHADVMRYLTRLGETARAAGRTRIAIGSTLPYTFGIETGRTRRGRLARRAGGAWMLRDGLTAVRPQVPRMIAQALETGRPQNIGLAFGNIGRMLIAAVRRHTPVRSGRLRDSFRVGAR